MVERSWVYSANEAVYFVLRADIAHGAKRQRQIADSDICLFHRGAFRDKLFFNSERLNPERTKGSRIAMKIEKSVARITIVRTDALGNALPSVIYRKDKKSKKQSPGLKTLEKITRHLVTAQTTGTENYLMHHKKSNGKKRDGWIRDLGSNVARAQSKTIKELRA
jgi:hypothetical protein